MKINVRIDHLILDGFEDNDAGRIGEAIEHELTRLFVENNPKGSIANNFHNYSVNNMDAGSFGVDVGHSSSKIGNEVARSVFQKIIDS